jgi:uncharacterized SAM-binding protein YcdF (DUF218 family)
LPIVAASLVTALGGAKSVDLAEARRADAIVILGGGVRRSAVEYGGDTVGRLTLERTRYGAHLARMTGLPMLVTGGSVAEGARPEADLMREVLEDEYRLPVRWTERNARNTLENARNAARMLIADGKRRVVLVTHGFDVRRSKGLFEAQGLMVLMAPTQVPRWDRLEAGDFLPSAAALATSHYCLYEALAILRDVVASVIAWDLGAQVLAERVAVGSAFLWARPSHQRAMAG